MSTKLNAEELAAKRSSVLTHAPKPLAAMKERLHKALKLACGDRDTWMQSPFHANGWNAATEAHILIGYKPETQGQYYDSLSSETNAKRVQQYLDGTWPRWVPASGILIASEVIDAMDKWPRVSEVDCFNCAGTGIGDESDEEGESVTCSRCGGAGELHAQPNEEQFLDPSARVWVEGIAHFKHFTWAILAPILTTLDANELRITHGSANMMLRLEVVGTPVVIGVMPVMTPDGPSLDNEAFYTLKPYTDPARAQAREGVGEGSATSASRSRIPTDGPASGTPKTEHP